MGTYFNFGGSMILVFTFNSMLSKMLSPSQTFSTDILYNYINKGKNKGNALFEEVEW